MVMNVKVDPVPARGFFARLMDRLRSRVRKLFGKKDEPNIYPFF